MDKMRSVELTVTLVYKVVESTGSVYLATPFGVLSQDRVAKSFPVNKCSPCKDNIYLGSHMISLKTKILSGTFDDNESPKISVSKSHSFQTGVSLNVCHTCSMAIVSIYTK